MPQQSLQLNPRRRLRSQPFTELLAVACDVSPSMGWAFRLSGGRQMTRLAALKDAASMFLTRKAAASRRTQVCVVEFAGIARLSLPWTPLASLDRVLRTIAALECRSEPTNVTAGLSGSLGEICHFPIHPISRRRAKILLITDGGANQQCEQHAELIRLAQAHQVRIFPVAICNRRDPPDSYDRALLQWMARQTRGRFNTAHNLEELKAAITAAGRS